MNIIPVTPAQLKQWDDTVALLGHQALSFRQLLYRLLNAQVNVPPPHSYVAIYTDEIPVAATDSKNILINPNTYFKYNLLNRVFILAHEIGHNILNDVLVLHKFSVLGRVPMVDGTWLPFDNDTMQWSMDARLNPWLVESKIGVMPEDAVWDSTIKGTDSVVDVYKKRFKQKPPGKGPGGQGPVKINPPGTNKGPTGGKKGEGFDIMLPPGKATGKDPHTTAAEHNPQRWAAEIAIARELEKMKNHGKVPGALERVFKEILNPKVPWTEHIKVFINRYCGGDDLDWTQQHPYYGHIDADEYFYPRDTGKGAGWIVIWDDTSGSRNSKELGDSRCETAGLLEQVNPRRLTHITCDAAIHAITELDDPGQLRTLVQKGGGGTSYQPVLDWIAKQPEVPDLFIGFTDGEVYHPAQAPKYPVIWASSTDKDYPFGDVVRIK